MKDIISVTYLIGVLDEENRKKAAFENIMKWNSPKLIKRYEPTKRRNKSPR